MQNVHEEKGIIAFLPFEDSSNHFNFKNVIII